MNAGESMNRLWSGMLLLGIAYGAFCGKLPEVTDGALRASKEAVVLAISLLGVTGLWSGLMEIARKSVPGRQFAPSCSLFPHIIKS